MNIIKWVVSSIIGMVTTIVSHIYVSFLVISMMLSVAIGAGQLPAPQFNMAYIGLAFLILLICEMRDLNARVEGMAFLYTLHFKSLNLDIEKIIERVDEELSN